MIKIEILVDNTTYDVTNDVVNIRDIEVNYKRSSFGEVERSFTNKFEFARQAYALVKREYLNNYLQANATVIISLSNQKFSYDEYYRNDLDFTTFEDDGMIASIHSKDNGLANKIKDNRTQSYDILVSDINEGKVLDYDRLELYRLIKWYFYDDNEHVKGSKEEGYNFYDLRIGQPITYSDNYYFPLVTDLEGTEYIKTYGNIENGFACELTEDAEVYMSFEFDIRINSIEFGDSELADIKIGFTTSNDGRDDFLISHNFVCVKDGERIFHCSGSGNFKLKKGDKIGFKITLYYGILYNFDIYNIKTMEIGHKYRNKSVSIDIVSPNKLLSALVSKITGENTPCVIEGDRFNNVMMVAAESIRGIKKAKFHTSFSKFTNWMLCFGYVYSVKNINGAETVVFSPRTSAYNKNIVRQIKEVGDFSFGVNSELVFSGVEVGYEKKDYDKVNGRDEFNVKNSFSTGAPGDSNTLQLISPYRADAYGFEFLTQKREETEDNDSDNDVFFVGVKKEEDNKYILLRGGKYKIEGNILSPSTTFNTMFSPRQLLMYNINYIGACTKKLTFTATEGNADVSINGISEKTDINIPIESRLFRAETINFSSPKIIGKEDNIYGLIEFEYTGIVYRGYINDKSEQLDKGESRYTLICESLS